MAGAAFQNPTGTLYTPPAVAIYTPANPTTPNSTSAFQCQGLGALLTPQKAAGVVLATVMATLTDSATTVDTGVILQLVYGPVVNGVAAPAVNTVAPGSAVLVGNPMTWATGVTLTTAADSLIPITLTGLAKNLTPGQQYWFDVVAKSLTANDVSLTSVTVVLTEIG